MQLGVRWRAGEPPHVSVPVALHAEITAQEQLHAEASAWTLTWLEGRPRCDLDGLVLVRLTADGAVVSSGPGDTLHDFGVQGDPTEDDDDWLK